MNNLGQIMKQAQKMQEKMQKIQQEIEVHEEEGSAGGGMVKICLNGKNEVKSLKIDPSLIDSKDTEMLEDLITAAFNDAKKKMDSYSSEKMGALSAGLPGGLKLPF